MAPIRPLPVRASLAFVSRIQDATCMWATTRPWHMMLAAMPSLTVPSSVASSVPSSPSRPPLQVRAAWQECRTALSIAPPACFAPTAYGGVGVRAAVPAFEIQTFAETTWAEVTLQQPSQRARSSQLQRQGGRGQAAGPADLSLVVVRAPAGELPNGSRWKLDASSKRELSPFISCETMLRGDAPHGDEGPGPGGGGGQRHLVLPLAGFKAATDAPTPAALVVHAAQPVLVRQVWLPATSVPWAMLLRCRAHAKHQPLAVTYGSRWGGPQRRVAVGTLHTLLDSCGLVAVVENHHPELSVHVQLDVRGFNLSISRGGAVTTDVTPPLHFQLLRVETALVAEGAYQVVCRSSTRCERGLAERHEPQIVRGGVHTPIRLPGA